MSTHDKHVLWGPLHKYAVAGAFKLEFEAIFFGVIDAMNGLRQKTYTADEATAAREAFFC